VVFTDVSLCASGGLPSCAQPICTQQGVPLEPWDVDISRHPTQKLAISAGGYENDCGLILASADDGQHWALEPHECRCTGQTGCNDCSTDQLYNDDLNDPGDLWRLKRMFALYGVAIRDADNSAVACGYSGQRLVRDPVHRVWRDRSLYTNNTLRAPQGITLPLFGAEAAPNGDLYVTGMSGYVLRSTDGGNSWTDEGPGTPGRLRDVWFSDLDAGWKVGQYFQISRTSDGGRTWTVAQPLPQFGTNFLRALAFSSPSVGVAVGEVDPRPGPHQGKPKILVTQDGGQTRWLDPVLYSLLPSVQSAWLSEAAAAGPLDLWAVGNAGLIVHTLDGGNTWNQFVPPQMTYADVRDISFEGVAFSGSSSGVFVGDRPAGPARRSVAFAYRKNGSQVQWTDASPLDTTLTTLADVAASGSVAYAVGVRGSGASREGVVLVSTAVGGKFKTFVPLSHPQFLACDAGEDLMRIPVLNEVEIAPDGDVWIGGECGRVWQFVSPSTWIEHKSETDAHVVGLSVPLADTGFLGCHRANRTGSSVVRFRP
jgi:photosystem II stability/assembly factor-like uncharacterized protein